MPATPASAAGATTSERCDRAGTFPSYLRSAVDACIEWDRVRANCSSVCMKDLLAWMGVGESRPQRGQGTSGLGLDGSGAATQRGGGGLDRQVVEEAQDDHRPLAGGELTKCSHQLVVVEHS